MSRQISKAYKFRIYPTKKQKQKIEDHFDANRYCYNHVLETYKEVSNMLDMYGLRGQEKIDYMKANDLYFSRSKSTRYLTQLAKTNTLLSSTSSTLRTYSMMALEDAYKKISLHYGFPKFKTKHDRVQSYTVQVQHHNFYKEEGHKSNYLQQEKGKNYKLMIPIVGRVKIKMHNPDFSDFDGRIRVGFYTISKLNEKYYVSINVKETIEDPVFIEGDTLGIDVGITRTITTSDESEFSNKVYTSTLFDDPMKEHEELRRLWGLARRKQEGSSSHKRALSRVYKERDRKINKAKNLRHQITNEILATGDYNCFAVEELSIAKMRRTPLTGYKIKDDQIGQRWHLMGIQEIMRQLEYKCLWRGHAFIKVPAFNTSITCSNCGHVEKGNRKSQSVFYCKKCGHEENADLNAAKNIAKAARN